MLKRILVLFAVTVLTLVCVIVPIKAHASTDYYQGNYKITFYCPCSKCCGKWADGYTATGTLATQGRTIAVDPKKIPYGSEVYIEGLGWFVAEDCGGAIKGNRIDVFMDDHQKALQAGIMNTVVWLRKDDDRYIYAK